MTSAQPARIRREKRTLQGIWIGIFVALFVLLIGAGNLFATIRLQLTDTFFVAAEKSDHIVLVALDDASFQAYGRSPTHWDRRLYADLLEKLHAGGARVVAFDLLFPEQSQNDELFVDAIQQVRASDTRTRVVMAVSGAGNARSQQNEAELVSIVFPNVLRPITPIAESVDYLAYVNTFADVDGAIRRQATMVQSDDLDSLSFSLSTYLAYLRIPASALTQVISGNDQSLQLASERKLYIDGNGLWMQNYFGAPHMTFPTVSMQAVLNNEVDLELFDDKIVLVGLFDASGATDTYATPSTATGQQMAGVEIQAHAIESLLRNEPLHEQSGLSQILLIVVFALGSAAVYVHLRWYWKLVVLLAFLLLFFAMASVNFNRQYEVMNLLYPGLALSLPVLFSIGWDITTEIREHRKTGFLLESVVAISDQHMEIDRILREIAADTQSILPELEIGAIWLYTPKGTRVYEFPEDKSSTMTLREVQERARRTKELAISGTQLALPLLWQQRLVGVIAVQRANQQYVSRKSLVLLEELALQIAPGLENVLLHSELQQQKELLEVFLHVAPTSNAILDKQFIVQKANDDFHTRLVAKGTRFSDINFFGLLAELGLPEDTSATLREQFSTEESFHQQLQLGDQTVDLYTTYLPIFDLWIVALNDITKLVELNRLKGRLIRIASHDLKNPLSNIIAYGSLLQIRGAESLTEDQQKYIRRMVNSGKRMQAIIEGVLDLEQARTATLTFKSTSFEEVVREVIELHEPDIARKLQQLVVEIADDLPMVRGQSFQLSQVIANLLDNAMKYTPEEGKITLRLSQKTDDMVTLEINDTGFGIPEKEQTKLFTEFHRVKTPDTIDIPGTGLGLSLVKSIVEVHRGRIWVESEEGVGSTFFVEIPVLSGKPVD